MKQIMSGQKFARIMQYLHVCSLYKQIGQEYNPSYKVQELLGSLHKQFHQLFQLGQQLSLDETLIQSFGRIKFKVCIISKAAQYGIKIYVLTDAATAHVLKVIVYTGKHTYNESVNQADKKTVRVVKDLCKSWEGTHCIVYVDSYYTLLELLKELHKMKLYVTVGDQILEDH